MTLDRGSVSRVHESPGHPEVNQENKTAFEPQNQILAAPIDCPNAFARQLRSHLCGIEGPRQPRVKDSHVVETTTDQLRFEACTYGLDLRQLGHGRASVPAPVGAARPVRGLR